MNQYLKCYRVVMRTLAPVFIGSGREIWKEEYIFLNRGKVGILDIDKLYGELCRLGKADAFEEYLLGRMNIDLTKWLEEQGIQTADIKPYMKYTLDCSDKIIEKDAKELQLMECMKDAYGNPYIPGSSLKGMIRTILLGADILNMPQKYRDAKKNLSNVDSHASRYGYLKKNIGEIEGIAYRTLQRERNKPRNAVNDVLQGLKISDSEPLSVDTLTLCQKIDVPHSRGVENQIPLLRECIKPDTEICFSITVDTQLCPFTEKDILDAAKTFMDNYYDCFLSAFDGIKRPGDREVFLGGGCGYVSKTVIYPLYGKAEGIDVVSNIYEKTNVPPDHNHYLDREYRVSPHTLKCTKYLGKTYQMGLCRIEKMELV